MEKLFKFLSKTESSSIVLSFSKIFKIINIIIGITLGFGIAYMVSNGFTDIVESLLAILAGVVVFMIFVFLSLFTEAILVGVSIIIERNYHELDSF